jgi:pSer/pThr/pTyr-binding forkhead associated (FHA) protein
MPAQIKLIVEEGCQEERPFVIGDQRVCVVGRATDCDIQLASDRTHLDVSRHHCEFEIDSPCIRVRDLGSLNGTFVNGRRVGGRSKGRATDTTAAEESAAIELLDGDEVRIGRTIIRVMIDVPSYVTEPQFFPDGMLWPL